MKYNPAEASVAWYGNDTFTVKNLTGENLYSIKLTAREATAELDALKATGLFQQAGTFQLAFNAQQTGSIRYSGDRLYFDDKAGNPISNFTMSSSDAEKTLDAIEDNSSVWFRIPGKMGMMNASALSLVKLRGDVIEFYDLNGQICETSTPTGPETAAPFVKRAKAAIDACKSIKPVTATSATGAPAQASEKPTKEERLKLKELFNTLKDAVFGQDDALEALAEAVKRARAGLKEDNKPIGSFLFLGPTGVGKTEAARQLAKSLGYEFKKFDMSEYMDKVSGSRLTGGSPNYVGYEEGGQLTNFVRQHPKCVLLFDEIEKAHPEVANTLLQVLDDARLTDGKGQTVQFNDTIIILTSNLGTGFTAKKRIGFTSGNDDDASDAESARKSDEVKGFFLPEFMNRLTDVIRFKALKPEYMLQMVDKFISELAARVKKQDTELSVTPEARDLLAKEGYSEEFGARPLKRLIEKATNPLADEMLFGELEEGGQAILGVEQDKEGKKALKYTFNKKSAVSNDNNINIGATADNKSEAARPILCLPAPKQASGATP